MRVARLRILLAVSAALAGTSACGNLSNEDLLFLLAVPQAHEVTLDVAEVQRAASASALVGEPARIYTEASSTADDINRGVEELLDFVDSLGRGYPPTERTADGRVWGPVADVDGKGLTLRVAITRAPRPDGLEGPRYTFCVQMGRDADIVGAAPSCGTTSGNGYVEVLGGHYDPAPANDGARSGEGSLRLDFASLRALGQASDPIGGVFALVYRFVDGGAEKQIAIAWEDPPFDSTVSAGDLSFTYGRTPDGMVSYDFALQADLVGGGFLDPFSDAVETLRVQARWQEGGLGRGDVTIEEGDVPEGQAATWTECWDAAASRTYGRFVAPFDASQDAEEGDPLDCPTF